MSDDLVKRARDCANGLGDTKTDRGDLGIFDDLADRIEELESKLSLRTNLHEECIYLLKSTEAKIQHQTNLVEQLFALLEVTEVSDGWRVYHPTTIQSSRALDAEKLDNILAELKRTVTANDKSDM